MLVPYFSDPYTAARVAAGYLLGNPELKGKSSGKIPGILNDQANNSHFNQLVETRNRNIASVESYDPSSKRLKAAAYRK